MSSVGTIVWSSVARKVINAVTGLGLCIFIVIHLLGNLTLLTGNAEAFNKYSHFLLSLGTLIYLTEAGLVIFFLFHMFTAVTVWWDQQMARPQAYKYSAKAGYPSKKTISSRTMIYTGVTILVFTILHLITFKYGPGIKEGYAMEIDGVVMRDLYRLTIEIFHRPGYVIWYVVSLTFLGFHLRHGFWSAFQSMGINHPRWTPVLYGLAMLFALVMAIGFIILPVVIYFQGGAA